MDAPEKNLDNIQTYIDFVKTNLEPLAQQLKVGVDFLWNILVKQAQVEAITLLIICVMLSFSAFIAGILFVRSVRLAKWKDAPGYAILNKHPDNHHAIMVWFYGIPTAFLLLSSVIATSTNLPVIVTGLVNPEYRAIEKIIEFAKPAAEKAKTEVKVETK